VQNSYIPHNCPLIDPDDIRAVSEVLSSGWVAHGPQVEALERDFVRHLGGGAACACSSGTAALFLALEGLGVGRGVQVAVPTYACSALLNAVQMAGAVPVVCDVREDDFTLDPAAVPLNVDVAVPVHVYGSPADVKAVGNRAQLVVEDCCQSVGGMLENREPLGIRGHAAIYSFYATKVITCGHGGLVWFPDPEDAIRAHDYRAFDCRRSYRPRFNLHLSDINATLAREQFSRIASIRARRLEIARRYAEVLPDGFRVQGGDWGDGRMAYRYVILAENQEVRDAALELFEQAGIGAAVPVEAWELLHRYLGLDREQFPRAERIASTTLSVPLYPALTDGQVERICEQLAQLDKA